MHNRITRCTDAYMVGRKDRSMRLLMRLGAAINRLRLDAVMHKNESRLVKSTTSSH